VSCRHVETCWRHFQLSQRLTQKAATGDDGIILSPLVRKGGALQIMQQQFKRAIGVAIVHGNVKHKLRHLHYVCRSVLMRPQTQVGRTTLRASGNPVKTSPQLGTMPVRQRAMQHINSPGMDSALVCSDTPQEQSCSTT
jgi:hypothetical protein